MNQQNEISISLSGPLVVVASPYTEENLTKAKSIPGGKWLSALKVWTYPQSVLPEIRRAYNGTAHYSESALELLRKLSSERDGDAQAIDRYSAVALPDGRTLYQHQREGVKALIKARKAILADDMGLGKTLQALIAASYWKKEKGCKLVVLAPVTLHDNWRREARQAGVLIDAIHSWAASTIERPSGPYVLVVDEAHYAQSLKAQRTKRMVELAAGARAVYLLTGTPIKNGRPSNLFPLLRAIENPLAANKSWYEKRYCAPKATRFTRWDTSGASNLPELHERLKGVLIRRLKRDCLDLPAKTRVFLKADASAIEVAKYEAEVLEAMEAYRAKEGNQAAEALVLLLHERHAAARAKIPAALETAAEIFEQGGAVVLFSQFLDVSELLATSLGCERLSGATPLSERDAMVQRFQDGKSQALVITAAGGVGITLHRAQNVILVDRPWTPGDAEQIEDRLHRIGQHSNVTATWLQFGEVDQKVDQLLEKKYRNIGMVLAGKESSLQDLAPMKEELQTIARELIDTLK